jgi:dihydroorotase-like cyclic amidohydrolase
MSRVSIILSSMRTLLRHGTIVNADGPRRADVLIDGERIARVDYNPYEGRTLGGAVETVVARGDIIVDRGRFVGAPGRGKFLKRAPFTPRSS